MQALAFAAAREMLAGGRIVMSAYAGAHALARTVRPASVEAAPADATRAPVTLRFAPLFLVSLTAIAYEIALTRWFAVAKWSEYGYWVISIAMVGLALSGVVLALWRDAFV